MRCEISLNLEVTQTGGGLFWGVPGGRLALFAPREMIKSAHSHFRYEARQYLDSVILSGMH